ncbi:MAG TPA: hypothetical protein PLU30_12935 [Verrucomicrobiae bacterium]|nr:hypothetical protein [Verrucomicrobiae bacterium]
MKKVSAIILVLAGLGGLSDSMASQLGRDNGFVRIDLAGGERRLVSVPLVRPVEFEGVTSGGGSNYVSQTGAFTAGQFNDAAGDNKYELEITSGRHIGLVLAVVSNSANSVFLTGELPASVQIGTTFVVRKSWTPGSLFGTNLTEVTGNGLKAGSTFLASTQIGLFDAAANAFTTEVFFRSTVGQWRLVNSQNTVTNLYDIRLGPRNAFFITEGGGAGAASVLVSGEVRKSRTLAPVGSAISNTKAMLANPNVFPMTLNSSGMYNAFGESSSSNSVQEATVFTTADEVTRFFGSNNSATNYYHRSTQHQWLRSGTTSGDLGSTPIGAGEGLIFKRSPAGSAYIAVDPQVIK